MAEQFARVEGYVERETKSGRLRSRVIHIETPLVVLDPDGEKQFVWAGSQLLVVDRVEGENAFVELVLDLVEQIMHYHWCNCHAGAVTHTPLDLRSPKAGGRE